MLGPLLRLLRAKERTIEAAYQRGYAAGQDWTMSRAVEERAHGVALGREMERAEVERLREGLHAAFARDVDLARGIAILRALLDGEGGGDAKR